MASAVQSGSGEVSGSDTLSERARNNYLYARAVVGREYFLPEVRVCDVH